MYKLLFVFFLFVSNFAFSQLVVNQSVTENEIAKLLRRKGVEVLNVSTNCQQGSFATFAGNSNINILKGLLITTGNAIEAIGPNDNAFSTGGNTGNNGSTLLETLPGVANTIDACEIVMEINSGCANEISFDYIFASEEYFDTVSTISDAAAIFISGAGFAANENIALLPSGDYLSINNVNDVNNAINFVNNGNGNSPPQNTDNTVTQYDGFTTLLTATAALQQNQNYTITFVIADVVDGGLDSGLFIADGNIEDTFTFGNFTNANNTIIEDCLNGLINIEVNETLTQSTPLQLLITGTAQNGIDFVDATTNLPVQSLINVNPGATNLQIEVLALQDNNTENNETINIEILDTCGNTVDSLMITIAENLEIFANTNDTITCNGIPIQLQVAGSTNYNWQPSQGLSCDNCENPMANPIETTQYIVNASLNGNCQTQDTILVTVLKNNANAGLDKAICDPTDFVEIGPDSANINLTYEWFDELENFISDNANLQIGVNDLLTFGDGNMATFVLETNTTSNCFSSDEVTVVLDGTPNIQLTSEKDTIFFGEVVQLAASGAGNEGNYNWHNTEIINNPTGSFTFAAPKQTTTFTVTGFTANGCFASANKTIYVLAKPDVFIPSAFSPNNDGENDLLTLITVDVESLELFQIFNRFGQVVYTATEISNDFWDGKFNGVEQEIGVYTYYLVANGINLPSKIIKRGNITLIK